MSTPHGTIENNNGLLITELKHKHKRWKECLEDMFKSNQRNDNRRQWGFANYKRINYSDIRIDEK